MQLTEHQVERRFQIASSSPVPVNIPGLAGLFFKPLTQGQKGMSSRAYSKALMVYVKEGLPSEYLVSKLLKQQVEASGMSMSVLTRKSALYEKMLKALPAELAGPIDQLTPDEVAELPAEEQEARDAAIAERNLRVQEALFNVYTPEEREELNQIAQIEALEQHLRQQTAEFFARRDQQVAEILMCAVDAEDKPYFPGIDSLAGIEPAEALVNLIIAWQQFREGRPSDFFSRS